MKKFTYPLEPIGLFEGAHPAHAYGGHAARAWSQYSALTIYEITALRFGMSPYTCESFWKDKNNHGTMHIAVWNSQVSELIRAVHAGEIRSTDPTSTVTEKTLVFATDAQKYFIEQDSDILSENEKIENQPLTESERKTLYRMLLAMAIDGYKYDPTAKRNNATGSNRNSIQAGMERVGLEMSDDTIREYLTKAVELFPEIKLCKS